MKPAYPVRYQIEFLEAVSISDIEKVKKYLESGRVDNRFAHRSNGWLVY